MDRRVLLELRLRVRAVRQLPYLCCANLVVRYVFG